MHERTDHRTATQSALSYSFATSLTSGPCEIAGSSYLFTVPYNGINDGYMTRRTCGLFAPRITLKIPSVELSTAAERISDQKNTLGSSSCATASTFTSG